MSQLHAQTKQQRGEALALLNPGSGLCCEIQACCLGCIGDNKESGSTGFCGDSPWRILRLIQRRINRILLYNNVTKGLR